MKKILVLDDDVDILAVVKLILTINHFTVQVISKWELISDTIQAFNPDLILLDVHLQGGDGREICIQLKKSKVTENIPVILFSASHNLKDNLNGCQPNAIITKPFDSTDLINTILNNLN